MVQCDDCTTRWESREDDGCNTIVLNCQIAEAYSHHNGYRYRDFDRSIYGDKKFHIHGDDYLDLCNSCWVDRKSPSAAMEVVEEDYHVDEKKVDVYYCDFCEEEIGGSVDDTVSVNPKIVATTRPGGIGMSNNREVEVFTQNVNDDVRVSRNQNLETTREEHHDICQSCKNDLFGYNQSNTIHNPVSGVMAGVSGAIKDVLGVFV